MANIVTFNGTQYSIPAAAEVNWASLSNFLIDVAGSAATNKVFKQSSRVITAAGAVAVSASADFALLLNKTVGEATAVNLPSGVDGMVYLIQDLKGDAPTNNITVTPFGTNTIVGGASFVMNQTNQAVIIQFLSGNWNVTFNSHAAITHDTKAVIEALPARIGTLYFATDENIMYLDDGTAGAGRLRAIATQSNTYYAKWSSSVTYATGDIVGGPSAGTIYQSKTDGNLNNAVSSATHWLPVVISEVLEVTLLLITFSLYIVGPFF